MNDQGQWEIRQYRDGKVMAKDKLVLLPIHPPAGTTEYQLAIKYVLQLNKHARLQRQLGTPIYKTLIYKVGKVGEP